MQLFHPDTDWKRVFIHIPHGILMALAGQYLSPVLCFVGAALFIVYELNEGRHTKDQAWKDILGAMVGFFGVIIIILIVVIIRLT